MENSMFNAARLEVDYESFLSQHDIIFERTPIRQLDCLLLGNGDIGLQIDASGSQLFFGHVMKSDVWRPNLGPEYLKNFASLEKLNKASRDPEQLEKIGERERSSLPVQLGPRPLGNIMVTLHSGPHSLEKAEELANYRQTLSLYDAVVETHYSWRNNNSKIISFAHARQNLLIFHYEDISSGDDVKRSVVLSRKPIQDFQKRPSFGLDDRFFWVKYVFPDGFTYVMMGIVDGIQYSTKTQKDEVIARLEKQKKYSFTVYVAIATNKDSSNPVEYARKKLVNAQNKGYKRLLVSHKSWWRDFWSKSFLTIGDEEAENYWYVGLYLMACSSRGQDMPNEFGPWAINEESASWGGRYWASEQPQMYWSIFSSNHPKLAEPYYKTYYNMLPGARENAKVLYKCRGASFGIVDRGGIESSRFPFRFMYESAANVGLIFWWGYLYTQDRKLLKEYTYPVIRELLDFYQDLLVEDKVSGKLELPTPCCLVDEFVRNRPFEVKNATYPLTMIKRLLMAGIEAVQILGTDYRKQKKWKNILSNLPELPSDGEFFLNYEGEDLDKKYLLLIPCPLGGIFPARVVNLDDSRCLNTLEEMFSTKRMTPFGCSLNWPYVCIAASWLGKANRAMEALHNIISLAVFPNGWASNHENIEHVYHRNLGSQPNMVVPSQFVACLNEMVVQSLYDGIIEVFKGTPENWNVRFANFRTVGAFLISSEKIDGEIPYVSITSLAGKKCHIKPPSEWQGKILRIKDIASSKHIMEIPFRKIVQFDTESGHTYIIERKDMPFSRDYIRIKARDVKGIRRYLGLTKEDHFYL